MCVNIVCMLVLKVHSGRQFSQRHAHSGGHVSTAHTALHHATPCTVTLESRGLQRCIMHNVSALLEATSVTRLHRGVL